MNPLHSRLPFGSDGRVHPYRAPFEFYPTPPEAVRALLSVESFDGPIWEPACGDGAIARELVATGYVVVATDLANHGYGTPGLDFLKEQTPRAKHIVTNPPYGRGLADRFVGHALKLTRTTGGSVAMLLNLASLAHPTRHAKFVNTPPAAIYALDELVCWPNGNPCEARPGTSQHRYCWVIWRSHTQSRPTFWWLSTAQFRDARTRPTTTLQEQHA